MYFDRIVLINLDKRVDRLGAFKAKVTNLPSVQNFVRFRAIHGDTVTNPQRFISGAGAWGCRQSHTRVLEEALLDGVEVLAVFEDDAIFADNFELKLKTFMGMIPADWDGIMLGGQDMHTGSIPVGIDGVKKCLNVQRTHAYVVRGKPAMQSLYRLWADANVHIDHLFGQWQSQHLVYRPDPYLVGQDNGPSDISGNNDKTRFWNTAITTAPADRLIHVIVCDRGVMEQLRCLGIHCGNNRDLVTGLDRGLAKLAMENWPASKLAQWATLIVSESMEKGDVPGFWYSPLPDMSFLEARMGRPIKIVEGRTVEAIVEKIPELLPAYRASKILWCYCGGDIETLEGMVHFGFHRGQWIDEISRLDQGIRQIVQNRTWGTLPNLVRQLRREIVSVRHGKVLLAHPELDVVEVQKAFPQDTVEVLPKGPLSAILNRVAEVTGAGLERQA